VKHTHRIFITTLALLASLVCTALSAQEPPRLALLIGNQGYTKKVGPLKNPHNDVGLVAASLTRIGFKVTVLKDASHEARTLERNAPMYV
jgi:Caspase domain